MDSETIEVEVPVREVIIEEAPWQPILLEVRDLVSNVLSALTTVLEQAQASSTLQAQLLETNANLTAQITANNLAMGEMVARLTPPVLPVIVPVIPDTDSSQTGDPESADPEEVVQEQPPAEVPPESRRPKRRGI